MKTLIAFCLLSGLVSGNAAVPDRDWPSVEVTPILDVPMRDTAITCGPDGTYYLTGTMGTKKRGWERDVRFQWRHPSLEIEGSQAMG